MNDKDLRLIRQSTAAGEEIALEFEEPFISIRIKNLTDGNIFVAFTQELDKSSMALIPSGCAEDYERPYGAKVSKVYILPEATCEEGVEARCLKW